MQQQSMEEEQLLHLQFDYLIIVIKASWNVCTIDLTREAESSRGHVATPRCPARSAPRGARSSGGGAGHARGPRTLRRGEPGPGHHVADAGLPAGCSAARGNTGRGEACSREGEGACHRDT